MAVAKAGWVITCPAYTVGPFKTLDRAQSKLREIETLGACHEDHAIEETQL